MIYYLDDEVTLLHIVAEYLTQCGFEIKVFSVTADFIFEMQKAPADLVLVDYRLEDANGLEVCDRLGDVKKILVTGELEFEDRQSNIPVMKKPFSLKDLEKKITEMLEE